MCGGDRPDGDLAAGNFVNPTLFADVDNDMAIATRRDLRPGARASSRSRDEAEAIRLANDTDYGLGASVQTIDVKRAHPGGARRSGAGTVRHQRLHGDAQRAVRRLQDVRPRPGGRRREHRRFLETKTVTLARRRPLMVLVWTRPLGSCRCRSTTSQRDDHIVLITIDRPEARNSLDLYHFRDLAEAWRDFRYDDDAVGRDRHRRARQLHGRRRPEDLHPADHRAGRSRSAPAR